MAHPARVLRGINATLGEFPTKDDSGSNIGERKHNKREEKKRNKAE